jgi:hypothetical protein
MTREEHLQWAKDRAIEYADAGDTHNAFASFMSDMQKHDGTADHSALTLMSQMYFGGMLKLPGQMKDFIEGFN